MGILLGDMSRQQAFQGTNWRSWAEKAPGSAAATGEGEQGALSWGLCHESPAQDETCLSVTVALVSPFSSPSHMLPH